MGSRDENPEQIDDGIPNILLDAFALTQGDRNASYGPFHEDYARVARTFRALTDNDGEPMMMDSAAGCLWMVLVKLGRTVYKMQTGIAYENPVSVQDDLTDAAGYLRGMFDCFHNPEIILDFDEYEFDDDDEVETDDDDE
jgi:hypothetical protein